VSFHRFEDIESHYLTPHLSTGKAPVIDGQYMYFCLLHKNAGTGSELHYHPNELLIFPLRGKINAIVGKDRRIVSPGTFVHAPAYARHSMRATEDGHCQYLYIKDKTWTVVGLAEDEQGPAWVKALEARGILVDHRPNAGIRVSPHFYTLEDELEEFAEVMSELRAKRKWREYVSSHAAY